VSHLEWLGYVFGGVGWLWVTNRFF